MFLMEASTARKKSSEFRPLVELQVSQNSQAEHKTLLELSEPTLNPKP